MSPNLRAFLQMIAVSELTARLLAISDNGYNVLVGSTKDHPRLFSSYADHPRQLIDLPRLGIKSTAAGRYQILARFFDAYKKQLCLKDFSPASQDAIAVQMIRECSALADIEAGRVSAAVTKCRSRWASLPGAGYGQHENDLEMLVLAFRRSGGVIA
ncbi:glycoside hydrolase family 104 protein [Massilia varians]|uniref:glycoside hydrolase family 24 protein n=1 Tax=Massilia varians TaxID=457921 RepID=UPI002554024D|nr:glycoside hydrolase family 104 protein [Massilia varians]MDK6079543.1 glycoside hydrolase family 104 protein [Massilia varians]